MSNVQIRDDQKLVQHYYVELKERFTLREFKTGATRSTDQAFDPEGFMSPLVIKRFCEYMEKHRKQEDGNLRASDNWQKGIPRASYIKSLFRHFMDVWIYHRHPTVSQESYRESLCAMMFNVMGLLYEDLNGR